MKIKEEKELVKYNNDLNKNILLSNLSGKEIDLFNAVCIKIRDTGNLITKISFDELKNLSNYTHKSKNRFISDIENACSKILLANWSRRLPDNSRVGATVFSAYKVDATTNEVSIKVNEDFLTMFNNLKTNLTVFNIEESNLLKSKYSKIQLRYLKEDSVNGEHKESYPEFKEKMGISKMRATNITERVLKPIEKELGEIFEDFQLTKEKKGREISILRWTWKESKEDPYEFFNDVFKVLNVNFTHTIQCKIMEMQKEMDKEEIKNLITEAWEIIKNNKKTKNPPALLSRAITSIGLKEFIANSKELDHKIKSNNESAEREKKWEKQKKEYSNESRGEAQFFNEFQELPEEKKEKIFSNAKKIYMEKTGNGILGDMSNTLTIMALMPVIKNIMNEESENIEKER